MIPQTLVNTENFSESQRPGALYQANFRWINNQKILPVRLFPRDSVVIREHFDGFDRPPLTSMASTSTEAMDISFRILSVGMMLGGLNAS